MKKVTVVVLTGDRGLCGGYNAKMLKLAERRVKELKDQVCGWVGCAMLICVCIGDVDFDCVAGSCVILS